MYEQRKAFEEVDQVAVTCENLGKELEDQWKQIQ